MFFTALLTYNLNISHAHNLDCNTVPCLWLNVFAVECVRMHSIVQECVIIYWLVILFEKIE